MAYDATTYVGGAVDAGRDAPPSVKRAPFWRSLFRAGLFVRPARRESRTLIDLRAARALLEHGRCAGAWARKKDPTFFFKSCGIQDPHAYLFCVDGAFRRVAGVQDVICTNSRYRRLIAAFSQVHPYHPRVMNDGVWRSADKVLAGIDAVIAHELVSTRKSGDLNPCES